MIERTRVIGQVTQLGAVVAACLALLVWAGTVVANDTSRADGIGRPVITVEGIGFATWQDYADSRRLVEELVVRVDDAVVVVRGVRLV